MKKAERAKRLAIKEAGGIKKLAVMLTDSKDESEILRMQWRISKWRTVPARWVLRVEKATKVSRHDLAPDLYPADTKAA